MVSQNVRENGTHNENLDESPRGSGARVLFRRKYAAEPLGGRAGGGIELARHTPRRRSTSHWIDRSYLAPNEHIRQRGRGPWSLAQLLGS